MFENPGGPRPLLPSADAHAYFSITIQVKKHLNLLSKSTIKLFQYLKFIKVIDQTVKTYHANNT